MINYDLKVDIENDLVSWKINNILYKLQINRLRAATILDDQFIYIKNLDQKNEMQVQYYSLTGDFVFSYTKNSGGVSWNSKYGPKEIFVNDLLSANIYQPEEIVIVLSGVKNKNCKLLIYGFDGDLKVQCHEPENYYFSYLSRYEGRPAIVCIGNEKTKDNYGRNDWKFVINPITGELTKISLAY
jgi:hypothetical protein